MRDFRKASTPPRCAYVVLLEDANPRAIRPLLAIWATKPAVGERLQAGPRLPLRRRTEDLELTADVVVREAWIDTGSHPSSKPRWIAADAGIAVPHRRAILGRWYVSMLTRHDRPASPKPVIIGAPTPAAVTVVDREPLEGSLAELGWRCVVLSGLAALAWWVT